MYSKEDLRTFAALFGWEDTGRVLCRLTLKQSDERNCCIMLDDQSLVIYHTPDGWERRYTRIHEFTHAICALRFWEHMQTVDVDQAEAAAFVGEAMARVLEDYHVRATGK